MRRLVQFFAIALASLFVACGTPVRVAFDQRQDFAAYRTWDWAPGSTYDIDAPDSDTRLLHERTTPIIERELLNRGFERARGDRPDFFVAYRLVIRRERVRVTTEGSPRTLSGLHGDSYTVDSVKTELRVYERSHLVIGVAGPDGRLIWVGQMEQRVPRSFETHLEKTLVSILTRFPPPSRATGRGPAHPSPLPDEPSLLAAMFSGVGTGAGSGLLIDDLR